MANKRNHDKTLIIRSISTLVKAARGTVIIPSKKLYLLVLNDLDPNIRAQALIALCHQSGIYPTDIILKLLRKDASTHVRCTAALCLVGWVDKKTIPSLIESLQKESDLHVRMYLLEALGQCSSEDVNEILLERMYGDPSVIVRSVAAGFLFEEGGKEILLNLCTSPHFHDRRAALRGFKHVKSSEISSTISRMANNDPEFRIRKIATRLLHKINKRSQRKGD